MSKGARGTPTRVAYRYLRTPTGWHHSPVGDRKQQSEAPDEPDCDDHDTDAEDDTYEEAVFDDAAPFVAQDSPEDSAPLSDQAAVEHEAKQWAMLWQEAAEYEQPTFMIDESILQQLFP